MRVFQAQRIGPDQTIRVAFGFLLPVALFVFSFCFLLAQALSIPREIAQFSGAFALAVAWMLEYFRRSFLPITTSGKYQAYDVKAKRIFRAIVKTTLWIGWPLAAMEGLYVFLQCQQDRCIEHVVGRPIIALVFCFMGLALTQFGRSVLRADWLRLPP